MSNRESLHFRLPLYVSIALILSITVLSLAPADTQAKPSSNITGDLSKGITTVNNSTEYESIQAAVNSAPENATIRIGPGLYQETVVIDKNVTIIGSSRTVLSNPSSHTETQQAETSTAITIQNGSGAAPTIRNIVIRGFDTGIAAEKTDGSWVIANTTFVNISQAGISAKGTSGNWAVQESEFRNSGEAVYVSDSNGEWTISNSVFENNIRGLTVVGSNSTWSVKNSRFVDNEIHGIGVSGDGRWKVKRSTFRKNEFSGISVNGDSNWTVSNSSFINQSEAIRATYTGGTWEVEHSRFEGNKRAINANSSAADWEIHHTIFMNSPAIVAQGAEQTGNATQNWWSETGNPLPQDCLGNVTCTSPIDQTEAGVKSSENN